MKSPTHKSAKHEKIEKTKSFVLATVIVASILASIALVLAKFLFGWWSYNNDVYGAQRQAIGVLENNAQAADELLNTYKVFEETGETNSDEVLDALPSKYDFNALNASIEYLVDQSGLTLVSISGDDLELSAENATYSPEPVPLEFRFEAEGSYADIQSLVSAIDKSLRPISLNKVTLSGTDQVMTIEAVGTTYYQPAQTLDYPERTIE